MNEFSYSLQAENIFYAYAGERSLALQNISFKLPQGKYIALVGPNGSGKSTLLRILSGGVQGSQGSVSYNGQDVYKMKASQRARHFAVVYQNEGPRFAYSVLETVLLGLHPYQTRFGSLNQSDLNFVYSIMNLTDTRKFEDKLVNQLSGGELQRVVLARALVQKPEVLFLDEAMSDLDISVKIQMIKILKEMVEKQGLTVIAIQHDLNTAYQFSDWVVALKDGQLVVTGQPYKVMDANFFAEVFNIKVELIAKRGFFIQD